MSSSQPLRKALPDQRPRSPRRNIGVSRFVVNAAMLVTQLLDLDHAAAKKGASGSEIREVMPGPITFVVAITDDLLNWNRLASLGDQCGVVSINRTGHQKLRGRKDSEHQAASFSSRCSPMSFTECSGRSLIST